MQETIATTSAPPPAGPGPEIHDGGGSSADLPPESLSGHEDETKIFYFIDDENTAYVTKVKNVPRDKVTLKDMKLNLPFQNLIGKYKFFFKSEDSDMGFVKEEIHEDSSVLPICENRIVSWLVSADGSSHSDGSNQKNQKNLGKLAAPILEHQAAFNTAALQFNQYRDQSALTTDSESMLSTINVNNPMAGGGGKFSRGPFPPQTGKSRANPNAMMARHQRRLRDNDSMLTSDSEAPTTHRRGDRTGLLETDDDDRSRVSTSTDITSVSRQFMKQRKRRKHYRQAVSRASSVTSVTESSMSLNIVTVNLNMEKVKFLGISIVGQSNQRGDGGIFVANIMPGGAVALDGRIEPGDMILQVNEVSFDNMTNDDAVTVLREAVQTPGPIRLVVAKCWEPAPRGYFTIPRQEPVRPIDPGAWVAHTNALRALQPIVEGSEGAPTPTPGQLHAHNRHNQPYNNQHMYNRPPSQGTAHSGNSGSGSVPESERYAVGDPNMPQQQQQQSGFDGPLDKERSNALQIMRCMALPGSGLEIRERQWLKLKIPSAFLGSEMVSWLMSNVAGCEDRKDARHFAASLLRMGYIKHTVNKITFSDQCYYVFGDAVVQAEAQPDQMMSRMSIGQPGPMQQLHRQQYDFGPNAPRNDDGAASSEHDTVGPLPPPPSMTPTPWALGANAAGNAPKLHAAGGTHLQMHTPSMASGYALMPFQYTQSGTTASNTQLNVQQQSNAQNPNLAGSLPSLSNMPPPNTARDQHNTAQPPIARSEASHSAHSSGGSSAQQNSQKDRAAGSGGSDGPQNGGSMRRKVSGSGSMKTGPLPQATLSQTHTLSQNSLNPKPVPAAKPPKLPVAAIPPVPPTNGNVNAQPGTRTIEEVSRDAAASRQSFRMAMDNPMRQSEFTIDVI